MIPIASAPRVVIAGGGPGGLAAASLLREAGAVVTVVERALAGEVLPARRAGILLGREAWPVMRRVGGGSLLDDAQNAVGEFKQLMSLRAIDDVLGTHAEDLGATVRRGASVTDVVDHGSHVSVAVHDAKTGVQELLDADWFIDATGGHSPLSNDPRFQRIVGSGPMELLPESRTYLAVQAEAIPARSTGWQAAGGAFAINNRTEGVVGAYQVVDSAPAAGAARDAAVTDLLRTLDIDPDTVVGAPYSFTAHQSLAPHAAQGRMLLVGDSAGTVIPSQQVGTSMALLDAERAATAILDAHRAGATTPEAASLIDAYDFTTVLMHRAFIQ